MQALTVAMADKIKPLTGSEVAESRKLKRLFNARKRELGLTQESLGALMGTTQGAVSHYLNGRARISDYTLLRFAHHLKIDPEEIRPGIIARMPRVNDPKGVSDRAMQFAREFDELPEADQEMIARLLERVRPS